MKKTTLLIILASVVLTLTVVLTAARGSNKRITASNNSITQTLDITDFNAIALTGIIEVAYTQSDNVSAVLTCPDNLVEYMDIRVKDNTLLVGLKNKNVSISTNRGQKINLIVSSPHLHSVSVVGTGSVGIKEGLLSESDVKFQVTGTGDIETKSVTCQKLTMAVAGTGDIVCDVVKATDVVATVAGTGDIECGNVTATNVSTSVAGTGDINFRQITCDNIGAIVSGTGDIELRGSANTGNYIVSGTGEISASQLEAKDVIAKVSGPGTIRCYATQTLSATTSEIMGTITYRGNPKLTTPNKRIRQITE